MVCAYNQTHYPNYVESPTQFKQVPAARPLGKRRSAPTPVSHPPVQAITHSQDAYGRLTPQLHHPYKHYLSLQTRALRQASEADKCQAPIYYRAEV